MMTLDRIFSRAPRKVSDRMTMPASISRTTLTPKQHRRSGLAGTLLAGVAFTASLLCSPQIGAQTTPTPQPVIVADFNHDGIPDVLVPSGTTPTATIAFGSVPYGTFSAAAKAVTFPAACTSFQQGSLLVGDFNGDGFPDIVFLCGNVSGIMIGNGDGTFRAATLFDTGPAQFAVLGDFNNDGKLDLVLVEEGASAGTQSLQLMTGNGDGTFALAVASNLLQQGYSAPVVADMNGDGYLDIVLGSFSVANGATPSVGVFGNNKDGTFGTGYQGFYNPSVTTTVPVSTASTIIAGNVFGLGLSDLVVPDTGTSPGLVLVQNTSASGTFSLGTANKTNVAGLMAALPGFFSGTPAIDLFISNGTTIGALANDGTGNFAATYTGLSVPTTSPLFAVADSNGDGYSDVYTATLNSGTLQLAVDVTSGSATATSQPFSLGIGTKAVSAAWKGNVNLLASNATGQQIVSGAASGTALTSSKDPSTVGDPVTFTATVAASVPTDAAPTGTIVISDGATTLASGVLSGGSFSYTTAALTQATHAIKATYAGDNYFAASASAVLSQVVNHAQAVASNLTWTTPAAIVYGTTLSGAQLNAMAVDANGVAIPGTFAYAPAAGTVLDAGARTLSVTFTPTDLLSFLPATTMVTLTVTPAAPVLTWATPASIAYGVALSATQLNATVTGVANATLPGTYTYNPVSGTVLSPGTQTLSVSFVPTNAVDYTNTTGSVKLLVTGVTVASFTPNAANLGDPATKITLIGAGFVATSVVQVNGTAIPTTLVSATTLTAIVPATDFTKPGTLQITVADPSVSLVSSALTLTVSAPNVAATISAPPTTPPGSQPTLTVTLTQPYPVDLVGTLTIGFTRSGTPQIIDPSLQFASGGTSFNFPIPANTTTIPAIQLQAGTIAGTIAVPLTLFAGGVNVTPSNLAPATIVIPLAPPSVSGMTVSRSGNQLTVVMHGFSNTREVVSAKFHFTAALGATLGTEDLTLPVDTIFNTDWFNTDPSFAYGSTFTYTQIFDISDTAANIGSVDATLTNTVGTSTSSTAK